MHDRRCTDTGHSDEAVVQVHTVSDGGEAMRCPAEVRTWYAKIGSKGGKRSKRKITPEQQAKMQKARIKK